MKSAPISFISLNTINQYHSHAIQMHMHAYTWCVCDSEPYSGIQGQRECLWTLVDPNMYMRHVDIFSHYSLCFCFLISSQKDIIIPYIINDCMTDFVRGWPVFCSENISEFFQLQPQTPSAFFGLQQPPSSRDTSEYFLFQAPSSSPQHYCTLPPLQPLVQHSLQRLLQDLFRLCTLRSELCSDIPWRLSKSQQR